MNATLTRFTRTSLALAAVVMLSVAVAPMAAQQTATKPAAPARPAAPAAQAAAAKPAQAAPAPHIQRVR